MSDFLKYVLSELRSSLVLVMLAGMLAAIGFCLGYFLHRRKWHGERKFPWGRVLVWTLFAAYGIIVFYATFLRGSGHTREWNLHLFRAWREAWNNFSEKNWLNVFLNIAMFFPMGFFLPFLHEKFRKWYSAIPACFGISLGIELLQLALARGICDVDDLFANTLGGALGFLGAGMILSLRRPKGERRKKILCYGTLIFVPILAIASIFPAYALQELGNLPMAPAYQNNTRHVNWFVEIPLLDTGGTATLYKTQAYSRSDCNALAEKLADSVGQTVDMVSLYQEMAYYNLSVGTFRINYYDGTYRLYVGDDGSQPKIGENRQSVEQALAAYFVSVPEESVFSQEEDGWYLFSCQRSSHDTEMLDGILRCRFNEDGSLREIQNDLVAYVCMKEVAILSSKEACARMMEGYFYDEGYFEYSAPAEVHVTSCTLDYEIDTKGYYQPVYRFTVISGDAFYQDEIMIPAIAE